MTAEQIAAIRAYCNSSDYDRSTAAEDLMLKALDEREALLKALKDAADEIAESWFSRKPATEDGGKRAYDAILKAKAES